jgi:glucokinase
VRVDSRRGVLLDVNEPLRSLIGQPVAEMVAGELARPVCMENDARMYALGELRHSAGRGSRNMVCLTPGTGIGSGVALDGRVLRGPRGVLGILSGHLTVQVGGPRCTCGNIGCLEALIGTAAVIRDATDRLAAGRPSVLHGSRLDARRIFEAAAAGDELAHDVVQRFAERRGAGVVTMVHAYDPDIVVLGGGMMGAAAQL